MPNLGYLNAARNEMKVNFPHSANSPYVTIVSFYSNLSHTKCVFKKKLWILFCCIFSWFPSCWKYRNSLKNCIFLQSALCVCMSKHWIAAFAKLWWETELVWHVVVLLIYTMHEEIIYHASGFFFSWQHFLFSDTLGSVFFSVCWQPWKSSSHIKPIFWQIWCPHAPDFPRKLPKI